MTFLKTFDLSLFSKHRQSLMGISTILILLCHASGNKVMMPHALSIILSRGSWGVDMFLLLSGIGLYYSLDRPSVNIKKWYKNRYSRILIPYFVIIIPLKIIVLYLYGGDIVETILDISTINFWLNHRGTWFIAMLIPLYISTPLLFNLFKKANNLKNQSLLLLTIVFICILLSVINSNSTIISNIQFVLSRVPAFIIGLYMGYYVKTGALMPVPKLIIMMTLLILITIFIKYLIPNFTVSTFLAVPLLFMFTLLLETILTRFTNFFNFWGKISLESYIFNVALPVFFINRPMVIGYFDLSYGNIIPYMLVIIIGTALAIFVNRISKPLINYVHNS